MSLMKLGRYAPGEAQPDDLASKDYGIPAKKLDIQMVEGAVRSRGYPKQRLGKKGP